jgi:hypothetical protein
LTRYPLSRGESGRRVKLHAELDRVLKVDYLPLTICQLRYTEGVFADQASLISCLAIGRRAKRFCHRQNIILRDPSC